MLSFSDCLRDGFLSCLHLSVTRLPSWPVSNETVGESIRKLGLDMEIYLQGIFTVISQLVQLSRRNPPEKAFIAT